MPYRSLVGDDLPGHVRAETPGKAGGVKERFPILLVGNFLSSSGYTVTALEELAPRLSAAGWSVTATSTKPGRLSRLMDMLSTVLGRRREYRAAIVCVLSGPAFLWAEAVCGALRLVRRPYVLTLHGGQLPSFSRRW